MKPNLLAEELQVIDELDQITDQVRQRASHMGAKEVRFLVDTYYQIQERRKSSANQERSLIEEGEPVALID